MPAATAAHGQRPDRREIDNDVSRPGHDVANMLLSFSMVLNGA
jgi:hypothetical protein